MAKRTRQQARKKAVKQQPGICIYHDMKVYENFERSALRIFEMVKQAEEMKPGAPRYLYIDIQGHRTSTGAYDHDAFELIHHFALEYLSKYLTEVSTPLIHIRKDSQQNDIPDRLGFGYPDDGSKYGYNANSLEIRPREINPAERKTPPTVRAIADYLGLEEAACLVCWGKPVERAHVVPSALGGSMDVRNFALLCKKHHAEAPDVADAESFWAWVDYAEIRDTPEKWAAASDDVKKLLRQHNVRVDADHRENLSFFSSVKEELTSLYGWTESDFKSAQWAELMDEFHSVLDAATGRHFSIDKKVSTYAWAYDIALRRAKGETAAVIRNKP
ncbi:HNH endonuclease signature motif containing protein [Streptomyces virginiae]|uniref:HNH endonuclease signature motif containing protein n=1 Tax=Streptomyces virginiae TaxID=1961 RepID=UPI00324FC212